MARAEIDHSSELFLFRGISKIKGRGKLRDMGTLSYTTVREQFQGKLEELGYSPMEFSLHSLWAGGASAAAQAGVPD